MQYVLSFLRQEFPATGEQHFPRSSHSIRWFFVSNSTDCALKDTKQVSAQKGSASNGELPLDGRSL